MKNNLFLGGLFGGLAILAVISINFVLYSTDSDINFIAAAEKKESSASTQAPNKVVVGYFTEWSVYQVSGYEQGPLRIDPSLFTHINYAFVDLDVQGNIIILDPWASTGYPCIWSEQQGKCLDGGGNFGQLKQLKMNNPNLKTLISVGGWTKSDNFSMMAANPTARTNFANNCVEFCKKYEFDGVDIDWEYPGFAEHSGRPEDTVNYTLLLADLYSAAKANKPPLLVTIAAPAGPSNIKNLQLDKIHQYLDWVNLMTYDFYGPFGGGSGDLTNHNAPLDPSVIGDPLFCDNAAVKAYLDGGIPPEKIVLGIPLYGRSFAAAKSTPTGLFSTYSGPGTSTPGSDEGMRTFADIKANLLNNTSGYIPYRDDQAKVPYLHNPSTGDFISYDDEKSFQLKVDLVKKQNLHGVMVWELSQDTFPQWDGMKAINEALK